MKSLPSMRFLLQPCAILALVLLGASGVRSQTYSVTSLADNGPHPNLIPNTLRWAIDTIRANPKPTATIEVDVDGVVVLRGAELPLPPTTTALTIRPGPRFRAGQRLTIDARGVSSSRAAVGLILRGANSKVTVPLTIRVTKGVGLRVDADAINISNLEIFGADQIGVYVAGSSGRLVRGFGVGRLIVDGAGRGVHLSYAVAASIGSTTGPRVELRNCTEFGMLLQKGTNNSVPHFLVTSSRLGVLVQGETDLQLGAGSRKSEVAASAVNAVQIENGAVRTTVTNVEISQNGGNGVLISGNGTAQTRLTNLILAKNAGTAVVINRGASQTIVGPGVVCTETQGSNSVGIAVDASSDTRITGSECSANHIGIAVWSGAKDLVITGTKATSNNIGVSVAGQGGLVLDRLEVTRNLFDGILLERSPDSRIKNCIATENNGAGILVRSGSDRTVIGPQNTVKENVVYGVFVHGSKGCRVIDSTVSDNSGPGINVEHAVETVVRGNLVERNRIYGIAVFFDSNNCMVGPGNVVRDTIGVGIKFELSDANRCEANCILGSSAAGIGIVENGTLKKSHTLISNLIDGKTATSTSATGISMRAPIPMLNVIGCTIVNNVRGIHVTNVSPTSPPVVDLNSSILWNNSADDFNSIQGLIRASHSTMQNPVGTGTNSSADPRFVDPVAGNWALRGDSPAIAGADAALVLRFGLDLFNRDALGDDRVVDSTMDRGAVERQYLTVNPKTMPARASGGGNGGGKIDFTIQYPGQFAGRCGWIFLSTEGPTLPLFRIGGRPLPLTPDSILTFNTWNLNPAISTNLWFHKIPANGPVRASIDYRGLIPPSLAGASIYACGVAADDCSRADPVLVTGAGVIKLR